MSVPTALELRERDKRTKPIKAKLTLTLEQWAAVQLGLETLIISALSKRPGVLQAGQEAMDEVKRMLKTVAPLDPNGTRFFESTPDRRGRKYLCSRCSFTSVKEPGELCASCLAPGAA